jgi:hypothetical protein
MKKHRFLNDGDAEITGNPSRRGVLKRGARITIAALWGTAPGDFSGEKNDRYKETPGTALCIDV